ncbi:MAG TPA: hypothetical protein VF701_03280 [Thermoanaerobaculia bacterium]
MRKQRLVLLLLIVVAIPLSLDAQTRFGVRAGITDGDPMIGTDIMVPLRNGFVLNPNVEFTTNLFMANADAHYDIRLNERTDIWFGAGLAFIKPSGDDYEGGVSLLAGAGARRSRWYPYGQARVTSAGGDLGTIVSVAGGIRF